MAWHFGGSDVGSDERAGHLYARGVEDAPCFVIHHVEFHQWRSAEAVDQEERIGARLRCEFLQDGARYFLGNAMCRSLLHAMTTRFTMNSDPHLHLVVADAERRLS